MTAIVLGFGLLVAAPAMGAKAFGVILGLLGVAAIAVRRIEGMRS